MCSVMRQQESCGEGMPFCNPFSFHTALFIAFMGRRIYKYEIISLHSQAMAGIANHEMSTNW